MSDRPGTRDAYASKKIVKKGDFYFLNILAQSSRNNLILVPTPHYIWGIMRGRDKN